jgi:hypothetical protein
MTDHVSAGLRSNRRVLCLIAGVVILAITAGIRIAGAFSDLWLDEIWSLELVWHISSPWAVFTGIHHDNNQYLNSLFLYFLGQHGNWPGYRMLSLVAGTGTVILAWLIGRRRDVTSAFFAMMLVGFSYAMILYSSEARGYACLVFFAFLVFYALELHLEKPRWTTACVIGVGETLGFLSQLTFLFFFCAVVIWSGWRFLRSDLGFKRALAWMLACHALPVLVMGWLYFVDLRLVIIGGGTQDSLSKVYVNSWAWIVGFPPGPPVLEIALLVAAICGIGFWMLGRERSDLLVFFVGITLIPILVATALRYQFPHVRHFLLSMAFLLILIGFLLARLYQRSRWGKVIGIVFMAGFILANGWQTMTFLRDGRGHYGEATRYLIEHTKGPVVTFGGNHDFAIPAVLQFYVKEAKTDKTFEYCRINAWPPKGPEWVIYYKESTEQPVPPFAQLTDAAGNHYELVKTFPTAPLTGLHWFIYHNRAR